VSAVDEALAELKKAEGLLAAAKAIDAAELPKIEVEPEVPAEPSKAPESPAPGTLDPAVPPVATEDKRGPMIKNGKLYASVR
jgi:hypothetical protein